MALELSAFFLSIYPEHEIWVIGWKAVDRGETSSVSVGEHGCGSERASGA